MKKGELLLLKSGEAINFSEGDMQLSDRGHNFNLQGTLFALSE